MRALVLLVLGLLGLAVAHETGNTDHNVFDLNSENFDSSIADSSKPWFVMFYAPWCGHCKNLMPTWEATSVSQAEAANWARVDCTASEELCAKYSVQGFPTLKLLHEGAAIEYQGERSPEAFVNFIGRMSRPPLTEVSSAEELKAFVEGKKISFIFFGDEPLKHDINAAAKSFQASVDFATTNDASLAAEFGIETLPALIAVAGDELTQFEGDYERARIEAWIRRNKNGPLPELGPQNFAELTGTGLPLVIHGLDPNAEDFAAALAYTKQVAKTFGEKFTFSWLDGVRWASYLQGVYNIGADQVPIVVVFDGANKQFFSQKLGSADELGAFLDSITSGALTGTPLDMGPEEPEGFEKYKVMVEDYIRQFPLYIVGGALFVGFLVGKLTSGGKAKPAPKTKKE